MRFCKRTMDSTSSESTHSVQRVSLVEEGGESVYDATIDISTKITGSTTTVTQTSYLVQRRTKNLSYGKHGKQNRCLYGILDYTHYAIWFDNPSYHIRLYLPILNARCTRDVLVLST